MKIPVLCAAVLKHMYGKVPNKAEGGRLKRLLDFPLGALKKKKNQHHPAQSRIQVPNWRKKFISNPINILTCNRQKGLLSRVSIH